LHRKTIFNLHGDQTRCMKIFYRVVLECWPSCLHLENSVNRKVLVMSWTLWNGQLLPRHVLNSRPLSRRIWPPNFMLCDSRKSAEKEIRPCRRRRQHRAPPPPSIKLQPEIAENQPKIPLAETQPEINSYGRTSAEKNQFLWQKVWPRGLINNVTYRDADFTTELACIADREGPWKTEARTPAAYASLLARTQCAITFSAFGLNSFCFPVDFPLRFIWQHLFSDNFLLDEKRED